MKAKELRDMLDRLDPDLLEAFVVRTGFDHSYRNVENLTAETAELMPDGHMAEYWDDENLSYPESKKIKVLVIG